MSIAVKLLEHETEHEAPTPPRRKRAVTRSRVGSKGSRALAEIAGLHDQPEEAGLEAYEELLKACREIRQAKIHVSPEFLAYAKGWWPRFERAILMCCHAADKAEGAGR